MGFTDAVKTVFSNYANFQGRARRSEYWYWQLFLTIVMTILYVPAIVMAGTMAETGESGNTPLLLMALLGVFCLVIFLPSLAVTVRRLHDIGKSGLYVLINCIPYIGSFILMIFCLMDSAPGDNQYGPNPKELS